MPAIAGPVAATLRGKLEQRKRELEEAVTRYESALAEVENAIELLDDAEAETAVVL